MGTRYVLSLFFFRFPTKLTGYRIPSHQEPMMRSTPIEFDLFSSGPWDYEVNAQNIYNFWVVGAERAKSYESIFTIGMRGAGDGEPSLVFVYTDIPTDYLQSL